MTRIHITCIYLGNGDSDTRLLSFLFSWQKQNTPLLPLPFLLRRINHIWGTSICLGQEQSTVNCGEPAVQETDPRRDKKKKEKKQRIKEIRDSDSA